MLTNRTLSSLSVLVLAVGLVGCTTVLPFVDSSPSLIETVSPILQKQSALRQVWPGFWSEEQAFLVYDPDGDALLYTPADPPPEYRPFEETDASSIPQRFQPHLYRHEGVPPGLKGMFKTDYPVGDVTATAVNQENTVSRTLTTLFHETFHTHQDEHFLDLDASKGFSFVDPEQITPALAAKAEVERRLLRRALQANAPDSLHQLTRQYLAVRTERENRMSATARRVETNIERHEGSATLIEAQATAAVLNRSPERVRGYIREGYLAPPLKRWSGSIQERMFRWRLYGTGAAIGLLLDHLDAHKWRERLETGQSFKEMLADAVQFNTVSEPKTLAQRTLSRLDYEGILQNGDEIWGSMDVPTLNAFYDAPAHVVIAFPDAVEEEETGFSFTGNFFQLAEHLMLIEASLYDGELEGFSLTVHDRDVLHDMRGALRLTVALPARPVIAEVSEDTTERLKQLTFDDKGIEVRVTRPVDVTVASNSIIVRSVPSINLRSSRSAPRAAAPRPSGRRRTGTTDETNNV